MLLVEDLFTKLVKREVRGLGKLNIGGECQNMKGEVGGEMKMKMKGSF